MSIWTDKFDALLARAQQVRALDPGALSIDSTGWPPRDNLVRDSFHPGAVQLSDGSPTRTIGDDVRPHRSSGVDGGGGERVAGRVLVPAPDDRLGLAERLAAETAEAIGHFAPTVHWFHRGHGDPLAFVVSSHPNDVFLADNLTDEELRHAIPHEVCHLWQFGNAPDLTEAEAERCADEFAYQITDLRRDQRREYTRQIEADHAVWRGNGRHPWGVG
jgi:hypothetical protein